MEKVYRLTIRRVDGGVFKVFGIPESGLCAVGVGGVEGGEHGFACFTAVAGERAVLFFVNGF